ncbi:putative mitochondrial protein, partial [Mucuna pruriens]
MKFSIPNILLLYFILTLGSKSFVLNEVDKEFEMREELKFFLELQIKQADDAIYIHQTKYVKKLLKKFKLKDCKSTTNLGLWFKESDEYRLKGYCDADYAGDRIERKNTSGGYHFIGLNLVSWASKRQDTIALSTTKR